MHKLYRCRHVTDRMGNNVIRSHEIHWQKPRMDTLPVAVHWIDRVFQHKGVKFYRVPWQRGQPKEWVVIDFVNRLCRNKRLISPYNVVVFLDFDDQHASVDIQNRIRETADIARCYHLDSRNNDCLQCADLLLGATSFLNTDPTVRFDYDDLATRLSLGKSLRDSQVKRYLAGYLATQIDVDAKCVYDLRRK